MTTNPWNNFPGHANAAVGAPQRIRILKSLKDPARIRELIDWPGTQPFVRLVGRQRIDQLELQQRPA